MKTLNNSVVKTVLSKQNQILTCGRILHESAH